MSGRAGAEGTTSLDFGQLLWREQFLVTTGILNADHTGIADEETDR
jgi:hypothetical protein